MTSHHHILDYSERESIIIMGGGQSLLGTIFRNGECV
jgi:hypothetical protein